MFRLKLTSKPVKDGSRQARKPGSVLESHLSKRLTRRHRAGNPQTPTYLALLREGVTVPSLLAERGGGLLHHLFTLTPLRGGLFSVALSAGFPLPGSTPAPCPVEPGLSSSQKGSGSPAYLSRYIRYRSIQRLSSTIIERYVQYRKLYGRL